ncbi:MAG: hypothetical protein ACREIT_09310, partial [Tepidisphaeraceae bacterium]
EYLRMEDFKTNALYTRHMVDYYLALATDKADPNRNKVIDAAIEFLKQYDTPDTQVQPLVRTRIGKMLVLKGDYEEAKKLLDSIGAAAEEIQPRPDVGQQFEARYFSVLADLAQQEWEAVDKGIKDLTEWSKANIKDENAHKGATAAISMLQYRHASAQAKAATDDDAKAAAQKQAVGVLLVLVKERPELQGIIYEQLMGQLPENPEYKTLDPLLLQALIRKGEQERLKSEDDPADPKTIERGIAAAQEFVSRKGQSGIDPESVETAALLIGLFHEKVGNKIAAGNAFLDYVEQFPSNPKNAQFALDYAMAQIAQLRQEKATDETYWKLYDRFLPVAIGKPFNRTEFAFEYAQRLQKVGEFENASQYYGMVPATDARALAARYFQLLALKQRLEDDTKKLESDARQKLLANMQKLADDVNKAAADALAGGDEKQQAQAKSMIVRTALLAADVARREQKDPQRVLQLLQGFEESVKGMPKENELLAEALSLRVNSYMAVGENSKATEALVALLNKTGGREGSGIVYRLLEKLEDDLSKARNAGDKEQIRQIARNRSELSTFLVSWAREHKDESIKRFYYRYSVFDAASKKLAADLEPGPEARRAGRETALKLYQALQQPDAVRQYRATLEGTETDPNYPDPQVTLGMGLIQYDLQNYQEAQKALGKLLGDRKLGTPTMITERDGQEVVVDNDQYWEATLKLMRSNIALAEKDAGNVQAQAGLEETKNALKRNYITWGARVGGKKFKDEYETLRKEMIPDFDWTKFATPDPTAATQPVAGTP